MWILVSIDDDIQTQRKQLYQGQSGIGNNPCFVVLRAIGLRPYQDGLFIIQAREKNERESEQYGMDLQVNCQSYTPSLLFK